MDSIVPGSVNRMTTMPQQPIDSVQVPQAVGLSPEVAFSVVGQAGLAPMFQARTVAGAPAPGVTSQWGQVPGTLSGQPVAQGQPAARVVAQNPVPGTWVPRGSVVYLEWSQVAPAREETAGAGWIVAAILAALLVLGGLVWFLASGGDAEPEPSKSPRSIQTVTETPTPGPTQTATVTATATATATATKTKEATETATATQTTTETAPAPAGP